jgi:type IV fimbrial biogenesis protein FimT
MSIKRQGGFTVTELLVTLVVIGILAAIAMPSLSETSEKRRLKAASEAILSDLRWVRSESIKQNTPFTVTFTNGSYGTWSYVINDGSADIKTVTSTNFSEFDGVSINQNFASSQMVTDNARGTLRPGTVSLSTSSYANEVRVSILGRVRICGNSGGYDAC